MNWSAALQTSRSIAAAISRSAPCNATRSFATASDRERSATWSSESSDVCRPDSPLLLVTSYRLARRCTPGCAISSSRVSSAAVKTVPRRFRLRRVPQFAVLNPVGLDAQVERGVAPVGSGRLGARSEELFDRLRRVGNVLRGHESLVHLPKQPTFLRTIGLSHRVVCTVQLDPWSVAEGGAVVVQRVALLVRRELRFRHPTGAVLDNNDEVSQSLPSRRHIEEFAKGHPLIWVVHLVVAPRVLSPVEQHRWQDYHTVGGVSNQQGVEQAQALVCDPTAHRKREVAFCILLKKVPIWAVTIGLRLQVPASSPRRDQAGRHGEKHGGGCLMRLF
eukprot:scaffold34814_cov63-Phaeocystis_antarctica.AAC.4